MLDWKPKAWHLFRLAEEGFYRPPGFGLDGLATVSQVLLSDHFPEGFGHAADDRVATGRVEHDLADNLVRHLHLTTRRIEVSRASRLQDVDGWPILLVHTENLVKEIQEEGGEALAVHVDVANLDEIKMFRNSLPVRLF